MNLYGFGKQKLRTCDERDIKKVDYGLALAILRIFENYGQYLFINGPILKNDGHRPFLLRIFSKNFWWLLRYIGSSGHRPALKSTPKKYFRKG